ncbi:alpha/beta-hydrolase [Lojkania enalia]|uniref:Alpha/beta-hydrolase n=1 Tax=Lojkania enalia TaxID=147567 RepID=A0A9P4K108_9PLEO|nr:alpha/beta-hydrolase [Didymosphaeria enalia]
MASFLSFFTKDDVSKTHGCATIILVPGAFHPASIYHEVSEQLRELHYSRVFLVDLPSVGAVVGRKQDIEAIRSILGKELLAGHNVLLVGHSYGATVIGEAVKDYKSDSSAVSTLLSRFTASIASAIARTPRRGRILGLVFLAGWIPPISEVTNPETKVDIRITAPPFFRFTRDKAYWDRDLEKYPPEQMFYNDVAEREAHDLVKRLEFSSFSALAENATYIPYTGDFTVTYVVCERDKTLLPAWSNSFIYQPEAEFIVKRLDAGHSPMVSMPKEVTEILRRAVGEAMN